MRCCLLGVGGWIEEIQLFYSLLTQPPTHPIQMAASNPQLRAMLDSNPQMRAMMSNPQVTHPPTYPPLSFLSLKSTHPINPPTHPHTHSSSNK